MLSRWLQRGGLGQVLAPDPSVQEDDVTAETSEFRGGVWSILAPDPNFVSPQGQSQRQRQARTNQGDSENDGYEHEHEDDVNAVSSSYFTPSKGGQTRMQTKKTSRVDSLVLSAAKDLASCVASPPAVWEDHKKFFNFCASTTKLTDKQLRKVKRMVRKKPSLVNARASKMGFITDGFTPLHAAVYVGNYEVVSILVDFELEQKLAHGRGSKASDTDSAGNENNKGANDAEKEYGISLNTRDLQGRTALHIASEQGHINIIQLLKSKMTQRDGTIPLGEHAPIDLTGRTPLGWAATSRESKACQNRQALRNELFSPGDESVYGKKTPALDRTGGGGRKSALRRINCDKDDISMMDLTYGFSDMPGHRIEMEDAICYSFPLLLPTSKSPTNNNTVQEEIGFFGVFDGHGDGGVASQFIADNIIPCLTSSQEWKECTGAADEVGSALTSACRDIDVDLRAMLEEPGAQDGGSTGIMAIVTSAAIVVGNVGDSRCILVQKKGLTPTQALQETLMSMSMEDVVEGENENENEEEEKEKVVFDEPQPQAARKLETDQSAKVSVKAMSHDHKPNLVDEQKRIEKAGLQVVKETFQNELPPSVGDDKKEDVVEVTTIWKIQKSEREKIAVSRAFGDFDYKSNADLKAEEQAIVCTPDIAVHERDGSRDMYLVLACDGVFDVMSNEEVGEFVANKVDEFIGFKDSKGPSANSSLLSPEILPEVGDELLKHCLELGSSDNMSVMIVALPMVVKKDGNVPIQATRKLDFANI